MPSILRIIDANANRAREALRVMEEAARFLLDDAALTEAIKQLRHDLVAALAVIPALESNRDTPGDVGTRIKTQTESVRGSAADVATAAGKRLSEALRAIEEYGKLLPPAARPGESSTCGFAPAIEQLRYRGYDLEQRLTRAMASGNRRQWRLCVLLSEELCPGRDWFAVARTAVDAGADCVQLREKSLDSGQLLARGRELVALCRPRGASVIINDRPDVALLCGADGVHLGQSDLPCTEVRRLVGGQLLVGVSTSRIEEAQQALRDGADYCGVGPMFATTTKHKDVIVGPAYLKDFLEWGRLPGLAIGGVCPDHMDELVAIGVRGVAVSAAVCCASDPAGVVKRLLTRLP